MNVDAYQGEMNRHFRTHYQVPILFFTQLIGLAFGMDPVALGIGTELVSAHRALGRIGIEVPVLVPAEEEPVASGAAARPGRKAKHGPELPMPAPREGNR
jgi:heterodisulfide reductase subunit B